MKKKIIIPVIIVTIIIVVIIFILKKRKASEATGSFPLGYGSKGQQVAQLQVALNRVLDAESQLAVDGIFGTKTRAALFAVYGITEVSENKFKEII